MNILNDYPWDKLEGMPELPYYASGDGKFAVVLGYEPNIIVTEDDEGNVEETIANTGTVDTVFIDYEVRASKDWVSEFLRRGITHIAPLPAGPVNSILVEEND